ncbi:MAG: endonuclease III domain-containing protein [Clostridia bacterium]|nr:endonuclease III domain-containing protein [Clostridia bacterium]
MSRNRFRRIYRALFTAYGPQSCWPTKTPFEMMVSAILTQNTAWANVEKALACFPELTPHFILETPEDQLAEIIRPSGFFHQKAGRLKTLSRWYDTYQCEITLVHRRRGSALRRELLALNGMGRETADSILLYAARKPFFVVDAYTRRIFTRLGFALPEDYDGTRALFEAALPRDVELFNEYHALIVRHAKEHCGVKPQCDGCPLAEECAAACNNPAGN